MSSQSVNPHGGRVGRTSLELTNAELDTTIFVALSCFERWNRKSCGERAQLVRRAATLMRERAEKLARSITRELGKPIEQSRAEVLLGADIIEYYADNAERFATPRYSTPGALDRSRLGVLFGVAPWNFPYYQLARFTAPHLMAGNVVMVKHAGCVPQCALAFAELWRDAGVPPGAYTNLFISYEQVHRIIDDPRIKGVALAGSIESGRIVPGKPD